MGRTNKRIWLEGDGPYNVGSEVTFETTPKGATLIRLVIGERAAYWPPVDPDQDTTQSISESTFTLEAEGTAVAWLLKNDVAVAGTLFYVSPSYE